MSVWQASGGGVKAHGHQEVGLKKVNVWLVQVGLTGVEGGVAVGGRQDRAMSGMVKTLQNSPNPIPNNTRLLFGIGLGEFCGVANHS